MTRPGRPAFTLIEVCVTLSLMGVFALFVVPLWNATWRVHKDAAAAEASFFRAGAAEAQLRADAWAAGTAKVAADGSLQLGSEPVVRWSVEADEELRLVRTAEDRRAFVLPLGEEPPAFDARPGSITLAVASRRLVCPAPRTEVKP